jgi:hypothetical protein
VPALHAAQLRIACDPVLDARQDLDRADDCGRDERGDER